MSQEAGLMRNYTDVHLGSNKGTDVIKLTCQEQCRRGFSRETLVDLTMYTATSGS